MSKPSKIKELEILSKRLADHYYIFHSSDDIDDMMHLAVFNGQIVELKYLDPYNVKFVFNFKKNKWYEISKGFLETNRFPPENIMQSIRQEVRRQINIFHKY